MRRWSSCSPGWLRPLFPGTFNLILLTLLGKDDRMGKKEGEKNRLDCSVRSLNSPSFIPSPALDTKGEERRKRGKRGGEKAGLRKRASDSGALSIMQSMSAAELRAGKGGKKKEGGAPCREGNPALTLRRPLRWRRPCSSRKRKRKEGGNRAGPQPSRNSPPPSCGRTWRCDPSPLPLRSPHRLKEKKERNGGVAVWQYRSGTASHYHSFAES